MKNNKVILSLVVASIAAMASVPELLKQDKSDKKSDDSKDVINLKANENKTEDQKQLSDEVKVQMDSMWSKKTPATKVGESVNILVDNYGSNEKNIKNKIYDDLKLSQYVGSANNKDSTNLTPAGAQGTATTNSANYNAPTIVSCHAACHGVCHGACHGSRGWRKESK